MFFSPKPLNKSNLFKYSQFNSYKLMINPLKKEEYIKEKHILNCQEWIKLVNSKNKKINKINTRENINIYLNKCINIPSKKYLAIESMNSENLALELDTVSNKIKLCAKNIGNSNIMFHPIDGSPSFFIRSSVIGRSKVVKQGKNKKAIKINKLEDFLNGKTLPGW